MPKLPNSIKLEDCLKCEYCVEYRDGFVMCSFYKRPEQRMTQTINSTVYLINCPKNEKGKISA